MGWRHDYTVYSSGAAVKCSTSSMQQCSNTRVLLLLVMVTTVSVVNGSPFSLSPVHHDSNHPYMRRDSESESLILLPDDILEPILHRQRRNTDAVDGTDVTLVKLPSESSVDLPNHDEKQLSHSTTASYSSTTLNNQAENGKEDGYSSVSTPSSTTSSVGITKIDEPNTNADHNSNPKPEVKITHQVSHVLFEVSEVGPKDSTIPVPLSSLEPTEPIRVLLRAKTSTMSPVFVPKISVDGRPLPRKSKRYPSSVNDRSVIPTEQPLDQDELVDKPYLKVDSHYASMSVGSPRIDSHEEAETIQFANDNNERQKIAELNQKEELKTYLSDEPVMAKSDTKEITSILDVVNNENDIESIVSPKKSQPLVKSNSTEVTKLLILDDPKTDKPTESTSSVNLPDDSFSNSENSTESNLPSNKTEVPSVLENRSSLPLENIVEETTEHDNTFKREALDQSIKVLNGKEISSLLDDYEKEDADLFAEDGLSRDPRIYVHFDEEAELEKKKKLKEKQKEAEKVDSKIDGDAESSPVTESLLFEDKKQELDFKTSVDDSKVLPNYVLGKLNEEPTATAVPDLEDILEEEDNNNSPPLIDDDEPHFLNFNDKKYQPSAVIRVPEVVNVSDETIAKPDQENDKTVGIGEVGDKVEDSPPTAAAVAEAAVLTDLSNDKPKESRALDSSLTADKHVLQSDLTPPSPPNLPRGVSAAPANILNIGVLSAIVCGVVVAVLLVIGLLLFALYQRRAFFNRPKALGSDRGYAGSDSGGYLDDQCQSSYTTSHLDIPKGCPDDSISLDNDSFLNSLESMTIQNLWTDNIKHTKL